MQAGAFAGRTIRLDVAKVADLKTGAKSKLHSIAGVAWHIEAKLCDWPLSVQKGGANLEVYVYCNSVRTSWSCEADIRHTLRSQWIVQQLNCDMINQTFPAQDDSVSKMMWGNILKPEDGGVVIESTVTVKKVVGVRDGSTVPRMSICDFTIPEPDISDVTLIIGEKRLYVSKQLLAVHSPAFRAMFFSNFVEKNKKEIPLEDIDVEDFLEFLHVIYPSRKPVTEANIDCLLSLADRFNSEVVMRECEAFLCGPAFRKLPLEKKLLYADRFGLSHLQILCFDSIETLNEVEAIRAKRVFGELSDKMKSSLLERFRMFD